MSTKKIVNRGIFCRSNAPVKVGQLFFASYILLPFEKVYVIYDPGKNIVCENFSNSYSLIMLNLMS